MLSESSKPSQFVFTKIQLKVVIIIFKQKYKGHFSTIRPSKQLLFSCCQTTSLFNNDFIALLALYILFKYKKRMLFKQKQIVYKIKVNSYGTGMG